MIDIKELRRLAEAATPGPWVMNEIDNSEINHNDQNGDAIVGMYDYEAGGVIHQDDALFIAASNPSAILSLLDHIEQQQAEIARLRKDAEEIHKNMLQAITDPENQPSQYGTVPMTMYEEIVDKYAALADKYASRFSDTSTQEVG